jgi:hypothetical protein
MLRSSTHPGRIADKRGTGAQLSLACLPSAVGRPKCRCNPNLVPIERVAVRLGAASADDDLLDDTTNNNGFFRDCNGGITVGNARQAVKWSFSPGSSHGTAMSWPTPERVM